MKFKDVTNQVMEASKGYEEIDPQMHQMFVDALAAFVKIAKEVYSGEDEGMEISSDYIKVQVFEKVFNVNLHEQLTEMVKDVLENGVDGDDINNKKVDNDLLSSIKNNIDDYLKD